MLDIQNIPIDIVEKALNDRNLGRFIASTSVTTGAHASFGGSITIKFLPSTS